MRKKTVWTAVFELSQLVVNECGIWQIVRVIGANLNVLDLNFKDILYLILDGFCLFSFFSCLNYGRFKI